MEIPLTLTDYLNRAELVYGDQIAVVDEPDQPAEPLKELTYNCLLYTSPSPRDATLSRMPSSA